MDVSRKRCQPFRPLLSWRYCDVQRQAQVAEAVSAQQVSDDELFAEWDDQLPEPSPSSDEVVRLRLLTLAGPSVRS